MRVNGLCGFAFLCTFMPCIFGCQRPEQPRPEQLERGCVFLLPGVEGGAWRFTQTVRGLRDAGLTHAMDAMEWGVRPCGSLINLTNIESNRRQAKDFADRISQYCCDYPGRPTTLLGYSGGGGLAVLVAESLPEKVMLDRLILISAAISPRYDLTRAGSRCRSEIVSFYSSRDWLFLGIGTTLFGTIDREYTSSAGQVGFQEEAGQLRTAGLKQIPWRDEWRALGHNGGHAGWLAREWARQVLAAYIDPALAEQKPAQ